MNKNIISDIAEMQTHYGFHEWVERNKHDKDIMEKFLKFRMQFLTEEYLETMTAYHSNDPEEVVDGLVDIVVIALGTLNLFGVDSQKAWDKVHSANMSKEVGVKESRPNEFGLPDLIKNPDTWVAPDHSDNHGLLKSVLS